MTNDVSLLAVGLGLFYSMGGYCSLGAQKNNSRRVSLDEGTTISTKTNYNTFIVRNVSEVSSSSDFNTPKEANTLTFASASTFSTTQVDTIEAPQTLISATDTTQFADTIVAMAMDTLKPTTNTIPSSVSTYPISDTPTFLYQSDTASSKPMVQNIIVSDSSDMTLQQKVMPPPGVSLSDTSTTLLPLDSTTASLPHFDSTLSNNNNDSFSSSNTNSKNLIQDTTLSPPLYTVLSNNNNDTPKNNVLPNIYINNIDDSISSSTFDSMPSNYLATILPIDSFSSSIPSLVDTTQFTQNDTTSNNAYAIQDTINTNTLSSVTATTQPSGYTPPTKSLSRVKNLQEVVVNTALGFQKSAKSLSYSAQTIKSDEINAVKDANFTNSITGKASNVTITEGAGGVGSATKIILRGNNSLNGTGQPLIIIDGMPVTNENPRTGGGVFGNSFLSPDGLSSLNPDDIEGMTILKGPAAAALYGSQAANGALLITTKSGKNGVTRVDVSTNTIFSTPAYYPKTQNTYGTLSDNYQGSWGGKITDGTGVGVTQFLKDFYQTGLTTSNTISFTAGNEKAQVFTSYANTYGKGLIPNNTLLRHNFDLRGTANFFNKIVEVDAKISYMQSTVQNPFSPGLYFNPLATFYSMAADFPINQYKNYTANNGKSWYNGQNWTMQPTANDPPFENPYWLINKVLTTNNQDRLMASANVKFNFTNWLNLQVRGTMDNFSDQYEQKAYQGTNLILTGVNGNYNKNNQKTVQYYTDALLSANKDLVKNILHLNALVGASLRDYTTKGTNISGGGRLFQPNFFDVSNINFTQSGASITPVYNRKQVQSVFYSVEFSYKNAIFITHTGRNDWSSTLPANANSYYYPSVGGAVVLTDLIKAMTSYTLSYLKLRASYTQVGNDLEAFIINPIYTINSTGGITTPTTIVKPGTILKPEITSSIEAGLDVSFFNNLIYIEGTYYKTNTVNQLFTVAAPPSSGFSNFYVNGGNVQNEGVELSVSISPQLGELEWVSTINFSKNINRIVSLIDDLPNNRLVPTDLSPQFLSVIKVGGSLYDMYAQKLARNPDGSYITTTAYVNGQPIKVPTLNATPEYVGNPNPDFLLSWGNSFSFKGVKLSFLIDGRFGGKVLSLSQSQLDAMGNSVASATARDNGGVDINGSLYDAQSYYSLIGGRNGAWGEYVYDATVIRLREVSLSYTFPASLLKKSKFIKGISVALIGRNLVYFYKPAPIDAELTSTTNSNTFLGIENFNLPASRSFGFSVNFRF